MNTALSIFPLIMKRVRCEIKRHDLLPAGSRVLVAVSGGQDSLALAELLQAIHSSAESSSEYPRWKALSLVHTDHCWPGDKGCARHVAAHAYRMKIPLHVADPNGEKIHQSEGAARDWRYAVLGSIAQKYGYSHVAVGHTQSDLAETLLFNLVHGAGADGLASLTWARPLEDESILVRPLLSVSRSETLALCQQGGIAVWNDIYNSDEKYARYRTREHVLPYLRKHYNPKVEIALAKTAHLLREDSVALEALTTETEQRCVSVMPSSEKCVVVNVKPLRNESISIQRRVMRRVLTNYIGAHYKTAMFRQVDCLVDLLSALEGSRLPSLPNGAEAVREKDHIAIHFHDSSAIVKRQDDAKQSIRTYSERLLTEKSLLAFLERETFDSVESNRSHPCAVANSLSTL